MSDILPRQPQRREKYPSLTGLDSVVSLDIFVFDRIQFTQTGGQLYSDTSPYEVSECSTTLNLTVANPVMKIFSIIIFHASSKQSVCFFNQSECLKLT